MKKILTFTLALLLLVFAMPAAAETEKSFVLAAVSANSVIIAPERITYEEGDTIADALLASSHTFTGIEQGFIYAVDGTDGNFSLFYDGNGYDLNAAAEDITALCIGVTSRYSEALLSLIRYMADYLEMGNVTAYPAAQSAYKAALVAVRNGDESAAQEAKSALESAVLEYNALFEGEKHTVSVTALQGDSTLASPHVSLRDAYGNVTAVTGTSLSVIAGEYTFVVSDGGFNRTEGTLTVTENTALSVTLPHGEWFGDVRILDGTKEPYPYKQDTASHTVSCSIPDIASEYGSLYLNVGMGDVPDTSSTRLRAVYVGLNGTDYSTTSKSWESTATALTNLVAPGMDGRIFRLEAQYPDENGHCRIQHYDITVTRTPTLSALSVSAAGTVLPLAFDPVTYAYDLTTVADTLSLTAVPFGENYSVEGIDDIWGSGSHNILVSAAGQSTEYTLHVTKTASVAVSLTVPDGVTAEVINAAGSVIAPVDGKYALVPGESYTCRSTKATHYHAEKTFTAASGLTVDAPLPVAEDWLQDIALYNGSNTATRVQYPLDSAFSPADHSYVFTLSDCNTTAYLQATSNYTVTALYRAQTTNTATHGVQKTVSVKKPVGSGTSQILTQVIARSGFYNSVTLRISNAQNDITYYQDYALTFARKLHLTAFALSDSEDALTLYDASYAVTSFDRDKTAYAVTVNREETSLTLSAEFPNDSDTTPCCGGYYLMIGGVRYEDLSSVSIPLDPSLNSETITLRVCHEDGTAEETDYTVAVSKTDPAAVTVATTPSDAVVFLTNDLNGKRVLPENGIYPLTPGCSYSYTVTRSGYVGVSGSYTAPETAATLSVTLEKAVENTTLRELSSPWPHMRKTDSNNTVVSVPSPIADEEAVLYWATKIGDGFDKNACGCPILVDGYLYTYAGTTIYKVDTVTGEIVDTGKMHCASSYAINTPTYANGMLFIGLSDGTVQAFNADTLDPLWLYRDPLGGQPNCPIVYHNGYVYTGFWVGETSKANYVCLSATDEDPADTDEAKLATWRYTGLGGFYWAGAYVTDTYLLLGTDDGASGYLGGDPKLLSFDPLTGELLDAVPLGVPGDIRCSITCENGKFYFTNKGGYFFEAEVSDSGGIESIKKLKLSNGSSDASTPAMSTCTPTVYNGRAYVGVSGTNQFGAYSGHNLTVIDIANWEIAYSVRTQGYPQTSGVLTNVYEDDTGCVYVYFIDNYTPGKLRVLEDRPGQTEASIVSEESYSDKGTTSVYQTAYSLFEPVGDQAQYAICSPIIDSNGTVYFKNDSAYLMAVGSAFESLEITAMPEKCSYMEGETFDSTGLQVTAHYFNGNSLDVTEYITFSKEPLTAEDSDFILTFPHVMYQNTDEGAGIEYPAPFAALSITVEKEAETPSVSYGDLNADSKINMADVSMMLRYIDGGALTEEAIAAANVSGDSTVNMMDVSLVLQYIDGAIFVFPAENESGT